MPARRSRRAAEVLPDRAAHVRAAAAERSGPGRASSSRSSARPAAARPTCSTTGRSTAARSPRASRSPPPRAGIRIAGTQQFSAGATDFAALAGAVAAAAPDCLLIAGVPSPGAVAVTVQLAAALPAASLFATASLAADAYVDPAAGRPRRASLDDRVLLTSPAPGTACAAAVGSGVRRRVHPPLRAAAARRDPRVRVDEPAARRDRARQRRRPDGRSGARAVRRALFATRARRSVLGVYGVDPGRRHDAARLRRLPRRRRAVGLLEGARRLSCSRWSTDHERCVKTRVGGLARSSARADRLRAGHRGAIRPSCRADAPNRDTGLFNRGGACAFSAR